MPKHTLEMPTPERREINWLEAILGSIVGGVAYWGLLQFPGRLLQSALRLPGRWLIYGQLATALERMDASLPDLAAFVLAHSLCLVPFALFGTAVLVRDRGWAATLGIGLFFGLMLALMLVWAFPSL